MVFFLSLSPGRTDSEVDARWKLGTTCESVLSGLQCAFVDFFSGERRLWQRLAFVLTFDDLRSLWSRTNLHASRRKFFTACEENSRVRLATYASLTCGCSRLIVSPLAVVKILLQRCLKRWSIFFSFKFMLDCIIFFSFLRMTRLSYLLIKI